MEKKAKPRERLGLYVALETPLLLVLRRCPHFGYSPAEGLPHRSTPRPFPTETARGERHEQLRRRARARSPQAGDGGLSLTSVLVEARARAWDKSGAGEGTDDTCGGVAPHRASGHLAGGGGSASVPASTAGERGTEPHGYRGRKAGGEGLWQGRGHRAPTATPVPGHGRASGAAARPVGLGWGARQTCRCRGFQ